VGSSAALLLDTHTTRPFSVFATGGKAARFTPLSAEHVDVVELSSCSGVKASAGPNHVSSIVDHNVQVTVVAHDPLKRGVGRGLRCQRRVQIVRRSTLSPSRHFAAASRVDIAPVGVAHACIDSVAGLREGIGGQTAKAARSSGDYGLPSS